ncbi:hypothetical protein [Candidatus Methanocrinis natronophilus]|uniref:Uncharacterized protein n=1 Tax=Candidatus Methanocrinis natronophilus TaxID=3033396 RepID=A0ABT5X5P5_9EURY|nr:hypothetical protein [Candidatus Methanocrinis natronophilus]MDF0590009.1 hypothetical protein [Candidatus Methanocrinis natronophilus]
MPDNIWYRFVLRGPATGNYWAPMTGYTKNNTFSWTTSEADLGLNQLRVWIAGQDYGTQDKWDSFGDVTVTINPAPTPAPTPLPQFQSLTANPPGPQNAGTTITLTATASGGVPGNIWYRFWLRGPATGNYWAPMTGYTKTNTFSWTTSAADLGQSQIRVWIAGQDYGTQEKWDSFGDTTITINPAPTPAPTPPPQFQSLTANPPGPQNAGTTITLTATASGGVPGNVWYRFWLRGPATGNYWAPMTGYTKTNTFSWTTSAADLGQSQIRVWIAGQDYGTQEKWDSFGDTTITINPAPTPAPTPPPQFQSLTANPPVAGEVAALAAAAGDVSKQGLLAYPRRWGREFGLEYRMGRASLLTLGGMGDGEIDRLALGLAKRDLHLSGSFARKGLSAGIALTRARPRTISGLLRNFITG